MTGPEYWRQRKWWENRIGRSECATCPRCGEEEETPDHFVFRCRNITRVKNERGRREWAREVSFLFGLVLGLEGLAHGLAIGI